MDYPADRGAPTKWGDLEELFGQYANANDEDDRAFELVREQLQAKMRAWVEAWPGPRRPE